MGHMQTLTLIGEKIRRGIRQFWQFLKPGPEAWSGAALGLVCANLFLLIYLIIPLLMVASPDWINQLTLMYFLAAAVGSAALLMLVFRLLVQLPGFFQWMLFMTIIVFVLSLIQLISGAGKAFIIGSVVLAFSLAGSGVWVIRPLMLRS